MEHSQEMKERKKVFQKTKFVTKICYENLSTRTFSLDLIGISSIVMLL